MTYLIQHLPAEERPRERLVQGGPDLLATAELIAIILGSGTQGRSVLSVAHELLARFGGIKGVADASLNELQQVCGIGKAKAVQLQATIALGYARHVKERLKDKKFSARNTLTRPLESS